MCSNLPTVQPGKLVGCVDPGENAAGPISRLLYVKDRKSNKNFLIDTGAAVSVVPYDKFTP